jgi:c-di-GMP-binding flagellar brake protein YcgR
LIGASSENNKVLATPAVSEKSRRERRQHRRVPCEAKVDVRLFSSGIVLKGELRDLSAAGCKVEFEKRFPVGLNTRLEIRFSMHGLPILLEGASRCIHTPTLIGIEFHHLSSRKKAEITGLIAEVKEKLNGKMPSDGSSAIKTEAGA